MPDEPGGAADILREAGVKVRVTSLSRIRRNPILALKWLAKFVPDTLRLRRIIAEENADVVAVMRSIDFQGAIAGRLTGVRVVWHVLDSAPPLWLRMFAGRVMRLLADVIPAMSPTIARMHGLDRVDHIRYIGPPSNETMFTPDIPSGQAFGPKKGPRVAVVAQLTPMKGIEYFIRAVEQVSTHVPDAEFIVVGGESDGHEPYAAFLRSEVTRLGLASRFTFTGARYDLPQIFADLDLLVIASKERSEGLPTVMLNAIMAGVPVLATAVGGIPDVIRNGDTGMLVPPADVDALADAMTKLLSNPPLRSRIAAAATEQVVPRYSLPAWETAYLDVFRVPARAQKEDRSHETD
jgi:glycosyltransferase involved in cell wall biosynthesis